MSFSSWLIKWDTVDYSGIAGEREGNKKGRYVIACPNDF